MDFWSLNKVFGILTDNSFEYFSSCAMMDFLFSQKVIDSSGLKRQKITAKKREPKK